MQITEFINKLDMSPDWTGTSVLSIGYEQESPLFLANFLKYLKSKFKSILSISAETLTLDQIKAQLEIAFLNNSSTYFIKDISELNPKLKSELLSYFANYTGPHKLIFLDLVVPNSNYQFAVTVPAEIDPNLYRQLFNLFYPAIPFDTTFPTKIFTQFESIPIESACLLMAYQVTMGKNGPQFFSSWFDKIISKELSTFTLSQYFFAKQASQFFAYWQQIKSLYPDEFWISYWSEQVWQAILFITRANASGILVAKQKASRLPFSFINKDWRQHTQQTLAAAHNGLYLIDHNIKNGLGTFDFELWVHKFFAKN